MYRTKFDTKMTKSKWNYTANMIMNVSGTVCQRIHYFPGKQWLAIDPIWTALKVNNAHGFDIISWSVWILILLAFGAITKCIIDFDDLHLQIIERIFPKASVDNSSAKWSILIFFIFAVMEGGGEQIFVKCFLQKDSDWMPHTGLKCLNANFIYYATHLPGRGGGGHFLFIQIVNQRNFCFCFFSFIFFIVFFK